MSSFTYYIECPILNLKWHKYKGAIKQRNFYFTPFTPFNILNADFIGHNENLLFTLLIINICAKNNIKNNT